MGHNIKHIGLAVIIAISSASLGFLGGRIGDFKTDGLNREMMAGMDPDQRQALFAQRGDMPTDRIGGRSTGTVRGGAGMTVGQILEVTDTTITVNIGQDGSQLVFITDKTAISKPSEVDISELAVGDSIFVSGETNSDGSLIATAIQVRETP